MTHDPIIQRAYDAAVAIIGETGHVTGVVLLCEIGREGLVVVFDDDKLPAGPLSDVLRQAADRIAGVEG